MPTFYARVGAAAAAGAPIGASVNIARVSSDERQAATAGRALAGGPGASFFQPVRETTDPYGADGKTFWDSVGGVVSGVGKPIMRALEWGTEGLGNVAEASLRTIRSTALDGDVSADDLAGLFAGSALAPFSPEWRRNWEKVVDAEASIGQTAWLIGEEIIGRPGTSGSGMTDPLTGEVVGPRVRSGGLDLLDDPNRRAERQEYFSEGVAHWTTGVGDAMWQLFADPLLVAGKAAAGAKAAAGTLSATDVARVADRSIEAAQLTNKQRRTRNLVTELATAFERTDDLRGSVSALSRSRLLRNSTDGGAIAYLVSKAGEGIDDVTERIAAREDILLAGMGDAGALARVGERSQTLAVQVEKMQASLDNFVDDVLVKPDLDDAEAVSQSLARANDRPLWVKEMEAQLPEVQKHLESLEALQRVGRPAGQEGLGQLSKLNVGYGDIFGRGALARDTARVARTIQNGPALNPIHLVTGRHLPGTFRLASDDAPEVFRAATNRARAVLTRFNSGEAKAEFTRQLAKLEDDFVSAGVGAESKVSRSQVMDQFDNLVDRMIAAHHGLDEAGLRAIHQRMRGRRHQELSQIATRVYRAREAGQTAMVNTGDEAFAFAGRNGGDWVDDIAERPLLRSQVEDWVSIIDPMALSRFAAEHLKDGLAGYAVKKADDTWHLTAEVLTVGNRLWKFGALLRPYAYFVRSQVDQQARLLSNIGAMKYLALAWGAANPVKGNIATNLRKMDKAEVLARTERFHQLQALDLTELRLVEAQARGADEAVVNVLKQQVDDLRAATSKPLEWKPSGAQVRLRNTALAARAGQMARLSNDGTALVRKSRAKSAYWDNDDFARKLASFDAEDAVMGLLTGSSRSTTDAMRRTGRWDLIRGNDPLWEESFERAVNFQIKQDALAQRILAGNSDDEIMTWLRSDPEGKRYLRDMQATRAGSAAAVIENARQHIDTVLPPDSGIRGIALERNVTAEDVADAWKLPSDRPSVPGELMDMAAGRRAIVATYEQIERKYFHWVAQMPDNMMGRHPFYVARFDHHATDALRRAGVADESTLTLSEINAVRREADRLARKDVARFLFDTSKQTEIGHSLRFLSPFYSAWEDTMVKWRRIISNDPAVLVRGWDVVRAPNAGGFVVDENGNRITPDGKVVDDDGNVVKEFANPIEGYVLLPVPGFAQEWAGASTLRIGKKSANVIFQGDPFWLPGPGPIAAIPANELIVRYFPEAWGEDGKENAVLKYLLPFGPTSDGIDEQALPSWARAAKDAVDAQFGDGRRMHDVFAQQYVEQLHLERDGKTEPLTDDERMKLVTNRTRNWALLRFIGTEMPFTWTPQSRLSYYKAEYNRYRREFGPEADDRFAQDYPDYFDMAISLSVNETGLTATDESWGAVQAYRNDMAQHPEYGWFWAGAANMGDGFSQGVYHAQLRNTVGPGTTTTFRSKKDPLEAARDAQVSQGWREFQQVSTAIRLRLEERGLNSLSAKGASDLKAIRDSFVTDLSNRNPQWAESFNEGGNPGKVAEFLSLAVNQINSHPELRERGDGRAMVEYVELREAIRGAMAQRGTSNINAESNADLKAIWDQFTAELVQRDMGFEQAWDRVLERDDLTGDIFGAEAA